MIPRIAHGRGEARRLLGVDGPIVVIDALRMSATVIVALSLGFTVLPVETIEDALAWGRRGAWTAGERDGRPLPELDFGNSPTVLHRALAAPSVAGRSRLLALTTTNGTPALRAVADHSRPVYVGSPLNLSALCAAIEADAPGEIGILLAGRAGEDASRNEDGMTAEWIAARLAGGRLPETAGAELAAGFARTEAAARLTALGDGDDVAFCAALDRFTVVPELVDGRLVPREVSKGAA